ncbi:hypothetical protein REPUB_Repub14bG0008300 [Reevesia pubescens]
MKVATLIDHSNRTWKMDALDDIFYSEDIEHICRIPLSRRSITDCLIWVESPSRDFSVKSAYFVARKWLGKGGLMCILEVLYGN